MAAIFTLFIGFVGGVAVGVLWMALKVADQIEDDKED